MDLVDADRPRIPEFYAGRSIFVTGVSGYMGKLLVEKLLWSCSDVHRIYVLFRGKRGVDFQRRFEKLLNKDVFVRMREKKKELLNKIVPLEGDVTLPELGLTHEQRSKLIDEVSVIFHCAASVRFDDALPQALNVNVKGTKAVIDLALQMSKLVAFVQVSTAYSNCDQFVVEETIYPPRADWRKTLEICEKIDPSTVNILSQKYMNHMPNTYVFSKSLAEQIVNEYADRIPGVIFRPSIVVSSMEEPFQGWFDNLNGPAGISIGNGTGVIRTLLMDVEVQPDFMPVDVAIRGMLVTAYVKACTRHAGANVYNWCAQERSISYSELMRVGHSMYKEYPPKTIMWVPSNYCTTSFLYFYVNFILFQLIPAFFVDLALRMTGKQPMLWKLQRKLFIAMRALSHFTLNNFQFRNKGLYDCKRYILEEDLSEFDYEKEPDAEYVYVHLLVSWKYAMGRFLKMKPTDVKSSTIVYRTLAVLDRLIKSGFWIGLLYVVYTRQLIPRFFNWTGDFLFNIQR